MSLAERAGGVVTNFSHLNETGAHRAYNNDMLADNSMFAEAYEGLIREARSVIKTGARYFFRPRMCMLQWRHGGLVNDINKTPDGLPVRLYGLWIG